MASQRMYQVCTRCILDTRDYPAISFNEEGVCNVCATFDELRARTVFNDVAGQEKLAQLLSSIRRSGAGKEYDCILTVSGGADSSYLAFLCREWKLRPLLLHVDNGWNSELAVSNVENIVRKTEFDLYTYVIDWEELRDLQISYLKASVIDLDVPSENALLGAFYRTAEKFAVKYILTGHNTMTEGWLPPTFTSQYKMDTLNLRAIQKKFGTRRLRKYPSLGFFRHFFYSRIMRIRMVNPLNFISYNKAEAKAILEQQWQWRDYGGKHYENIFTRFYQGYILPRKYGVDKRKAHLSTLICSGQITRDEALNIIRTPPYENDEQLHTDKAFFLKKLGISEKDFDAFIKQPAVEHSAYSSYLTWYHKLSPFYHFIKRMNVFSAHPR